MTSETADTEGGTETISVGETDEGEPVDLPIAETLTGRASLTGKSGSGKSNSASVVIEELLERGYPVLVVDTDGEYFGLKEEYELLHAGADEECDIQVGPEHAGKLADLALEQNVPIILDVSGYLDAEMASTLIRETARELFATEKKLKKPFLLVVEEIHEYLPEGSGLDETGEMLTRIAKRGRKRGLGLVGISQRPADVKKDFITQANWLVWHRLTWQNDTQVVRRVVSSDVADAVGDLDDGEAFLQADWREADVERVQFRRKRTFDAGATPGLEDVDRPELKSIGENLLSELSEISDRADRERDRIAQLERALDEKDETIADLEEDLDRAQDMSNMAEQFTSALSSSAGGEQGEELQASIEEIREEKNEEIRELKRERDELRGRVKDLREANADLTERVDDLEEYEQAVENLDELREAVSRMSEALGMDVGDSDAEKWRKKLANKDERIDDLETQVERLKQEGYSLDEEFSEKMDFVRHEAVREEITRAAGKTKTKEDHTWDVISVLIDNERVKIDEIVPFVGVSRSSVSGILSKLADHGVVSKSNRGRAHYYALNIDGMKSIIQQQQKREEMNDLKQQVRG